MTGFESLASLTPAYGTIYIPVALNGGLGKVAGPRLAREQGGMCGPHLLASYEVVEVTQRPSVLKVGFIIIIYI